ncbi:cephalosporin hydroxylase [Bordetella genomosp. 5]|uniref:Cephalosporin hydroxylase n=1 Tax=Bordetella genomosp. 5 TaxID=1395608 RepID=A0A261TZ62_9BORD|nr:cephalosporin hydroxylase family protein [Bordetella genomosp. 5]OZI44970.1 cephalosporin hydroxylase [Bordetella genomosp. 5]OZI53903.1 cephalosporin hydroxylase [Bordetella genomosp. 5]
MSYLETTPDGHPDYRNEKQARIEGYASDDEFRALSNAWRTMALERKYMNNFSWLGRPLIQLPQDAMAMQELIWAVKPDLVIETGIAHGGSLILSASMLELVGHGEVVGVDIEIRQHNRDAIESHPLAKRISLIEGSSIDAKVIDQVRAHAEGKKKILVCLDSNHTHEHVLAELEAYAPLVSPGSYCVVFDTFVEDMPADYVWQDRGWGKGNNPKTAVWEYLKSHPEFEIDRSVEDRLLVTSAPDGFLRRKA